MPGKKKRDDPVAFRLAVLCDLQRLANLAAYQGELIVWGLRTTSTWRACSIAWAISGASVFPPHKLGIDPDGDVQAFEGEAQLSDEGVISGGVGNEYRAVTHAPLPLLSCLPC